MTEIDDYTCIAKGTEDDPFPVESIQGVVDLTKRILADRITGQRTAAMDYIVVPIENIPVVVCV